MLLVLGDVLIFVLFFVIDVLFVVCSGFFDVVGESVIKEIVFDEVMGCVQVVNQGCDVVFQFVGGFLGGLLFGVGGWLVGVVMMFCYVIVVLIVWMLGCQVCCIGMVDVGENLDYLCVV